MRKIFYAILGYMNLRRTVYQVFRNCYLIVIKTVIFFPMYLRFKVRIKNEALKLKIPPPYAVLANHCSHWDPFILNFCIPDALHYLTSHSHFRAPVSRALLSAFGCIPKSKNRPDPNAIKEIIKGVKHGECVGIFPEGQNSWDGVTVPIVPATVKLVKLLRIPILIAHIEGSYFSDPRWKRHSRSGTTTINFKRIISSKEIKELSSSALHDLLTSELAYSDTERQRSDMFPCRGIARAEYLERTLFACPSCLSLQDMYSRQIYFQCSACKYTLEYTEQGFFEPLTRDDNTKTSNKKTTKREKKTKLYFESIPDWNKWQQSYLKSFLKQGIASPSKLPIFTEPGMHMLHGGLQGILLSAGRGELELYPDKLVARFPKQERRFFLADIESLNIQKNEHLEFVYHAKQYSVRFKNPRASSYKWQLSIEFLRNLSVKT